MIPKGSVPAAMDILSENSPAKGSRWKRAMKFKVIFSLALLFAPGLGTLARAAEPEVILAPGEYATLQQGDDGRWSLVEKGSASDVAKSTMEQVPAGYGPTNQVRAVKGPMIPKNAARFTLTPWGPTQGAPGMMLVVSNGYEKRLTYRAALRRNQGNPANPTTICPILPHTLSLENWPYAFAAIETSDLELRRGDERQSDSVDENGP